MRALLFIASMMLMVGVPGSADAAPPGSCSPWPQCRNGGDGSGDAAFFEACKDLTQWTVTGNWSASAGECSAKNTGAEHFMDTAANIDLSGVFEAHLSYEYRIENADPGEFLSISVSPDGGASFFDVNEYVGSESGTVSLNLADHVALTDQVRLRASCLVSANDEVCGWDNIKIETVASPPDALVVTIDTPQARTYGAADFPLTYEVTLGQMGTADYSLNGGALITMTADEGSSGTLHADVQVSLPDGSYTFQVFATDELGNTNDTQSVAFNVDNFAPAVAFDDPTPPDGSIQSEPNMSVSLSTHSGLDHYSFVDFDSDLFLWMKMEEVVDVDNVVRDSSVYGNHGVAEGDAFQNPNGRFGSAFEFDGINHGGGIPTDRIVIPGFQDRHPIFDSSFTVMAWARPDVSKKMVIVGTKSITALPGWHLRTSGGSPRLRIGVNTGYTSETAAIAQASDPMEAGVWVHVVGTYDSTVPSIQLYLDGVLIDTVTEGVSSAGYGNDLELAVAVPEDPQKAWDGLVDDVLIFNRALDANEIKALYDSTANRFQNDYQGLGSGLHEFVGHSVDAAGNGHQTEVRGVTIN